MPLTRRNFLETLAAVAAMEIPKLPGGADRLMASTKGAPVAMRAWTPQEHPRLFFGRKDVEDLRAKRKADPIAAAAWARVEAEIEKGMAVNHFPRMSDRWEFDTGADNQKNLGMTVSESFNYSRSLALSWALDRVTAHARKATDLLMALCDWDFWTSPRFFGTDYGVPWRGQIETAGLCHLAACGYDWLYDFMTETERHRLRTCLLYKGILPIVQDYADPLTRLPVASHMKPYYNFWQVSVALAGEATMALYREHPLAERYARLCKDASDWWFRFEGWTVPVLPKRQQDLRAGSYFPPNFDSEGGYWEGLNYMDAVLITSFYFGESYRRQTGMEILPMDLMQKVAGFILNASFRMGDRMRGVNFSDTRAGFATSPTLTAYLARRLRHSGLQWFLQNCQNNFNDASHFRYSELPAFTYLWYDPTVKPQEPEGAVPAKVYPGMSVAVMRSGWGHDDTMLALKCGVTAGHSHPDANSFVLYSRDELLLTDSGVCGYEMPEYLDYYHTTRAHSTVLVGNEGQIKRRPGKIVAQAGVPELGFVLGDATAPYEGRLSRFLRGTLFIGNQYYVVADWLSKESDAPFQWLLHYDGKMKQEDQAYVIRKGKAALSVRMIEPKEYRLAIKHGYKTYNEDFTVVKSTREKQKELERSDYFEITPARNEKRQRFLTVLYPFAAGGTEPVIQEVREQGWVGVRVSREGGRRVDLVGLRLSGSGGGLEQVETDAPLFCLTQDEKGEPKQAMVYRGTYLKAGGKTILASPKPATLAIEL